MKTIDTTPTSVETESPLATTGAQRASIRSSQRLPPGRPQAHIALLVEQIEPQSTREVVQAIFEDLFRLLDCLRQLESHLRQLPTQETLRILVRFRLDASSLLDFIHTEAIRVDRTNQILIETLDGISFAVSHDLQRIFETELKALDPGEADDVLYGRFKHSLGVLKNCLQQSLITLGQVFEPALDGSRLFDDSRLRLRQSLWLHRDLSGLVQLVERFESKRDPQLATLILRRVGRFQNESLCFLMYKDWKEFENFNAKIRASINDPTELSSVFHLFLCYLRALLGQVKLRTALADVFCDFFEDELEGRESDSAPGETANQYHAELFSLD